jgi:hypothetical protein
MPGRGWGSVRRYERGEVDTQHASDTINKAQLWMCAPRRDDRAFDSGAEGRWFESTRAYHKIVDLSGRDDLLLTLALT